MCAVEMGVGSLWYKYADKVISFDEFGESGADKELATKLGFTAENVMRVVWGLVKK